MKLFPSSQEGHGFIAEVYPCLHLYRGQEGVEALKIVDHIIRDVHDRVAYGFKCRPPARLLGKTVPVGVIRLTVRFEHQLVLRVERIRYARFFDERALVPSR